MSVDVERALGFRTRQLHAGYEPDETGSRTPPLFQTTSFVFDNTEHAAEVFALQEPAMVYTRVTNPTTHVLEERLASLEGGLAALATSSGHSAQILALLTLLEDGDHIVASNRLYGGTYHQLQYTLPKLGIETTFVDPNVPEQFDAAVQPNTKVFYGETLGNPDLTVFPFEEVSKISKKHHIPVIIDNTFATAYLARPLELGAHIVVSSITKFYGGHGTSIGGIIVDGGTFDWSKDRKYARLTDPDVTYGGLVWTEGDLPGFIFRARGGMLRDIGTCIAPFNSWLITQGLETLSVRLDRHRETTEKVIAHLQKHPKVQWVSHPSLPEHPSHARAQKYLKRGAGSVFGFGPVGGREGAQKVIEAFQLIGHAASIGDTRTVAIHPASTTHAQLDDAALKQANITPDFIRLSVGLEDVDDLLWDLDQALAQIDG